METNLYTGTQNVDDCVPLLLSFEKRKSKMNFYSVRDFRTSSKKIWETLSKEGEVVVTNNGKPTAILLDVREDDFEEVVQAVRQAKAMIAFNKMRLAAAENGFMTEEEIEKEISLAREERKKK